MCLNKLHWLPKKAKEDIQVWKIVRYEKYYDDYSDLSKFTCSYRTNCMDYELPGIPCTIKSSKRWWTGIIKSIIGPEGVHAWINKPYYSYLSSGYAIVRCKIPKGAMYYEEDTKILSPTIAASKLIFEEVVEYGPEFTDTIKIKIPKGKYQKKKKHGRRARKKNRKA